MQLIPVLDLKGGLVVRGKGGQRESYRPIETKLANGARPEAVARRLIDASGARTLYIADLDAIMDRKPQVAVLQRLFAAFPAVTFWVDAGFACRSDAEVLRREIGLGPSEPRFCPVMGSETLDGLDALKAPEAGGRMVLSLDFGPEGYRGPLPLLDRSDLWPDDVIVMSLVMVGADRGPDLARLKSTVDRAGARRIHAAGGVRGPADMAALEEIGVAGALVASALHDGRLGVC